MSANRPLRSHAAPVRRPTARRAAPQRPPRPPRPRRSISPWQVVSGSLALILLLIGIVFFASPIFYVTRIDVGGIRYLTAEEIFAAMGIANYHVLWVDPTEVAGRITSLPNVNSARVIIHWPARLLVFVEEREPALVWEQAGERYWVDAAGHMMSLRAELPGLLHLINEGTPIPFPCPLPSEPTCGRVDPDAVGGALQLETLRENIDVLYYDPVHGLSYQDGRGWRAYFGVGMDMEFKLVIYEALVGYLQSQGIQPIYIDVGNPDAPFYRVAR